MTQSDTENAALDAFTEWRNAPVSQRGRIARAQTAALDKPMVPASLLTSLRSDPDNTVLPNGKLGRHCSSEELWEMLEWAQARFDAARALRDALVLHSRVGTATI